MTDLCKRNDLTIPQCGDADCACIEGSFLKNEVKAFRSRCRVQCVIHDQAYGGLLVGFVDRLTDP